MVRINSRNNDSNSSNKQMMFVSDAADGTNYGASGGPAFVEFCEGGGVTICKTDEITQICVDCAVALALTYFAVTCCVLVYKLKVFNSLPYDKSQAAIVFYKVQVSFHTAALLKSCGKFSCPVHEYYNQSKSTVCVITHT